MTTETTLPQEPNDADRMRRELAQKCNEVAGGKQPVLAEVLSHFPKLAELFIQTQQHAAAVEGKPGVYFIARHRTRGYGLLRKTLHEAGGMEYLAMDGYTGESILEIIKEVDRFRGQGNLGSLPYYQSPDKIRQIISIAKQPYDSLLEDGDKILKKTLEVMNVTDEEITVMRMLSSDYQEADRMHAEAADLRRQADALKSKADQLLNAAQQRVEELRAARNENNIPKITAPS